MLLLSDGSCVIIEDIKVKKLSKPETTYNFEVEDFHTYYVGEQSVLVHNMSNIPCNERVYRGYNDSDESKVSPKVGMDTTKREAVPNKGISVNTDPNHSSLARFDHVIEVTSYPEGLMLSDASSGLNPGHRIIAPQSVMEINQYKNLLELITFGNIYR